MTTAGDIAKLRAKTGAGMLDCKQALEEADGNLERAVDILRKRGAIKAAKRADKVAAEGVVVSYIHGGGKVGVLVEVNCETDFVGKTDAFQTLAKDIALHIAALCPQYISRDDVPADVVEKEKIIYAEQLRSEGKPEEIMYQIVEKKIEKFFGDACLLEQPFVRDETKTIRELLIEKTAEIGEKITIRRFCRYELGEGIEKHAKDFAQEVSEQLG